MKIKKLMFVIIVAVIICFILFNLILINNIGYRMFPISNKATLGDSKQSLLDYPWGNATNITVFANFANLENISTEDRENYNNSVNMSLKWWENDKTHNLSYNINFTIVDNLQNANIIINYTKTVSSSPSDRGYTHVNSTGRHDSLGENVCDTYKPPYTKCSIEIHSNLSQEQNLFVIKHEIGHALGLMHSFTMKDFLMAYTTYFGNDPVYSEIMFDFSVYNGTTDNLFNFYKNFKWNKNKKNQT